MAVPAKFEQILWQEHKSNERVINENLSEDIKYEHGVFATFRIFSTHASVELLKFIPKQRHKAINNKIHNTYTQLIKL